MEKTLNVVMVLTIVTTIAGVVLLKLGSAAYQYVIAAAIALILLGICLCMVTTTGGDVEK